MQDIRAKTHAIEFDDDVVCCVMLFVRVVGGVIEDADENTASIELVHGMSSDSACAQMLNNASVNLMLAIQSEGDKTMQNMMGGNTKPN